MRKRHGFLDNVFLAHAKRRQGLDGMCGTRLREYRPASRFQDAVNFAKSDRVGGMMMQCVEAQHTIEAFGGEWKRLSPRHDERGIFPEDQAAVGRETLPSAAHHFE